MRGEVLAEGDCGVAGLMENEPRCCSGAWTVIGPDAGTSVRGTVNRSPVLMFPSGATTTPGPSTLASTVAA